MTPQKLAFPFLVGALAWVGAMWVHSRSSTLGVLAIAALCVLVFPLDGSSVAQSSTATRDAGSWQDQIDLAAGWIAAHGPPGRYGAADAGLLGYELDGHRSVVNLDGLVNDYQFVSLVDRGASLRERVAASRLDVLVNRLPESALRQFSCGTVLWTSPGRPAAVGDDGVVERAPIYVIDVRHCR
jgi:hypothetical protein